MHIQLVRTLTTLRPLYPRGPCHLAAGSGLVEMGEHIWVVADDSTELGVFCLGQEPGRLRPLFDSPAMPSDEAERKQVKPDLEAITRVEGGALALGSGSALTRERGVFISEGEAVPFDLHPLYHALRQRIPDLNIEGVAAHSELARLRLAHRGQPSQLIDLDLPAALAAARVGASWGPDLIRTVTPVDLGRLGAVPLSITDLAPVEDGRCIFTAAAEDTSNPIDDGPVAGSVVGLLSSTGQVLYQEAVDGGIKLEGVAARRAGELYHLLLITDQDQPGRPSTLYSATLPARAE